MEGMFRKGSVLGLVCVLGLAGMLGGCKAQKKADLAIQEAAELRERNATLEQSNRDKDAKIAELETAMASGRGQASITYPQSGNDSGAGPAEIFQQNSQGEMVATIAGNVLFDSGRADIKTGARTQLNRVVQELNTTYRNATVRVEGHTDSDPIRHSKWGTNEALSEARARAVEKYLTSRGVPASRVTSMGLGSSKPKSTKAASRRVEIVVETR